MMDSMITVNITQNIGKSELLMANENPVCMVYPSEEQCLAYSLLRLPRASRVLPGT